MSRKNSMLNQKTMAVELKKMMTKKAYLELQKQQRGLNGFNTGTRTFKDGKDESYERKNWDSEYRKHGDDMER